MSPASPVASGVRRPLRVLAALVLAGIASQAQALSLGEARVISGLNAPLVAEIAVVDATPEELADLRAEIPDRDVFARYGLDRPGFLADASVTLRTSATGEPVLVLRTEQAVAEPIITVLVAVNWSRGRVLREFNLMVDRPSATAESLTPMEVETPAVAPGRSGTVERTPSSGPEAQAERAAADSVTVRYGDTLSRIAASIARRDGVTASQAMVGIYDANRGAFGASMHELRAGAVLRIPDAAELAALPPQRVTAEVNRAVSQWRRRAGALTQRADATGRLRLVAPSESSAGTGGKARVAKTEGDRAGGSQEGRGAAAAAPGAATTAEPIEQRLARAEQQLLEKQRLVEVASAELARLQAKASAAPQEAQSAQNSLMSTLQGLFGTAWWAWGLLVLALLGLGGMLAKARRRIAAAEAELQALVQAPRQEWSMPKAEPQPLAPEEDMEGDPPSIEEAGSKIDLARAFIEMGDRAAARVELEAVLRTGDPAQRAAAQRLLDSLA